MLDFHILFRETLPPCHKKGQKKICPHTLNIIKTYSQAEPLTALLFHEVYQPWHVEHQIHHA